MDKFSPSDNLVEELASNLDKYVQIADHHGVEDTFVREEVELDDCSGSEVKEALPYLNNYESFPSPRKTTLSSPSSEKEDEEPEQKEQPEMSAPEHVSLKLVSAMKGSREKRGADQTKLRVTWAPDVYDPPPTSVSHVVRKGAKQQKLSRKDKRHGKKGHKGKDLSRGSGSRESSNGASGKDKKKKKKKKQCGQTPAGSNTCYRCLDAGYGLLDLKPDQVENFDIGIVDASCGSSFLKTSITKAHYPVAEAS